MTQEELDRKLEKLAIRASGDLGAQVVLDRVLTLGAAQIVAEHGSAEAARQFRQLAERIEGGALRNVDPTARRKC